MKILSNVEFVDLTKDQSNRLKAIAKERLEKDPSGFLDEVSLQEYAQLCACTGDKKATRWLKSLKAIAVSGSLSKVRNGLDPWNTHVLDWNRKVAQKSIPFGLNDPVLHKETGKRGTIADYNVDTEEFVVVFNPFQVAQYKASDLIKVG